MRSKQFCPLEQLLMTKWLRKMEYWLPMVAQVGDTLKIEGRSLDGSTFI